MAKEILNTNKTPEQETITTPTEEPIDYAKQADLQKKIFLFILFFWLSIGVFIITMIMIRIFG